MPKVSKATPKKRRFQMSIHVGASWTDWAPCSASTVRSCMATADSAGRGAVEQVRRGALVTTIDGLRRFRRDPAAPVVLPTRRPRVSSLFSESPVSFRFDSETTALCELCSRGPSSSRDGR